MSNAIGAYLASNGIQRYIELTLKDKKEQFILNTISVVNQNQMLAKCSNNSVLFGALAAWDMGLSLSKSLGEAYLVPYGQDAQLQIGYKGLIQLALRTNEYLKLNATPIYQNQFIYWDAVEEELELNNVEGSGEIVGYCAYFKLKNGFSKKVFWSLEKIENHGKKFSKSYNSVWKNNFDAMACKTVLKDILNKYGLKSQILQKAIELDQSTIKGENEVIYPDNPQNLQLEDKNTVDALLSDYDVENSEVKE